MKLSDKIVASYVEGFSGLYINCSNENVDKVASDFESMFEEAWNNAMDELEEDYNAVCVEKEEELGNPASIKKNGSQIVVTLEPLCLMLNEGARADNEYGPDALKETLKELKDKYTDISYEGLIAYEWSDEHSGDVVNEEISSENADLSTKTYRFVGDILELVFNDEFYAGEFWEKMEWQLEDADEDDYKEIMSNFIAYNVPEEAKETLLERAEGYDEELREELEKMMSDEDE